MPNWCENDLTIKGPQTTLLEIEKLIGLDKTPPEFDFNKIIPYPLEYAELDKKAEAMRKTDHPDRFKIKDGFNSGGYEWCIKNWGTKWNVGENDLWWTKSDKPTPKISLSFSTAWSPPEPIIKSLASQFLDCSFYLKYRESGEGFKGTLRLKRGEITKETCNELIH